MSLSLALITQTREELASLAVLLAKNINPEALLDAAAPIIWSNYGSYNAGKSLVAETAASHISGDDVRGYFESEAGMFGFDSEFHSYRDDQNRQYQFADIFFPWSGGLFPHRKRQQRELVPKLIEGQTSGGILFIHNAPEAARENGASLEMNILERRKFSDAFNANARQMPAFGNRTLKRLGLKQEYKAASRSGDKSWIRAIDLTIHNPDIFVPEFIAKLDDVAGVKHLLSESLYESDSPIPTDL